MEQCPGSPRAAVDSALGHQGMLWTVPWVTKGCCGQSPGSPRDSVDRALGHQGMLWTVPWVTKGHCGRCPVSLRDAVDSALLVHSHHPLLSLLLGGL